MKRYINRAEFSLNAIGLGFLLPLLRIATGDKFREQAQELKYRIGIPMLGIVFFLMAWSMFAPMLNTSLGTFPGPVQVVQQAGILISDHALERNKATAFYAELDTGENEQRRYIGKPTYLDQIGTSLTTVALGFLIASLVAVPLGLASGFSKTLNEALNPLIQLFKPVSPLAWLPIVTVLISAPHIDSADGRPGSLLVSVLTVTLCSLWPTMIKTTLGVVSVNKDLLNVARVLQLTRWQTVCKVVLPSAMPTIFTGFRLSLGVAWMVVITTEMLVQNPGLGKFVWDEFQDGSPDSLARIMVAVLTIGIIGFVLDRIMFALQQAFIYTSKR